jgi:signal transduction histidine kinase
MRLATKLLASLALAFLVTLAVTSVMDRRRSEDLMRLDLEYDVRAARAVRELAMALCETSGTDALRQMIERANPNLPRDWQWLRLDELPTVPGRDVRREVETEMTHGDPVFLVHEDAAGNAIRSAYIAVSARGTPEGVIAISHSLKPRLDHVRRGQMQTAGVGVVVLLLAATLAAALGYWMVGRPLEAITTGMRALGDGKFDAAPTLRRSDELGQIATELRTLGTKLAARERARHGDRLRTIGQLVSGIAHELGTPLSVVAVRAGLIASGEATGDAARASASAIVEQAQRMTALVRQLLDYARRGSGIAGDVDVQATVHKVTELVEPLARGKAVEVRVHDAACPVVVRAEAAQIQQVVTNLVMNGIQALSSGGHIDVTIGRGRRVPPPEHGGPAAEYAWVEVRDDGPGIAPEHLDRIFEPFFTTKPVGEGTGLGLAVAQTIAVEHGGWIAVESEVGRGTTFTVALPPQAEDAAVRKAS